MSLASLMVHDVTVVHAATTTDRYGNESKDWAGATRAEMKGWVAQQNRSEVVEGREALVSGWVAFLPATATIEGGDRVEWTPPGAALRTFEVDGPPNPAHTPRGRHHWEAQLREVTG